MADITPTWLAGLIIPHRWWDAEHLWAAQSSYTQASPRAGVPVASTDTDMVLEASGSQASGTKRVQVQGGGYPERDGVTVIVDDNDGAWMGWDPPSALSSYDTIGNDADEYLRPSAAVLPSGRIVVASCEVSLGVSTVRAHRTGTDGDGWSVVDVHSEAASGTHEAHPALVVLPSGRVLCFFLVYDGDSAQVRCYRSTTGGSWTLHARSCLPEAIDVSAVVVERMVAAYASDGIALVISYNPSSGVNKFRHYASNDGGSRFTLILDDSVADVPAAGTRYVDVKGTPDGGIQWVCLNDASTTTGVHFLFFHRAAGAFESLADTAWLSYTRPDENLMTDNAEKWPALVVADDGAVYCYLSGVPSTSGDAPVGEALVSYDDGVTFARIGINNVGTSPGRWWWGAAGTAHPWSTSAVWYRGGVHLYANHRDDHGGATNGTDLEVLRLGGHTTVTMEPLDSFRSPTNAAAWTLSYVPYAVPGSMGWTASGTAATESVSTGALVTTVGSGDARLYTLDASALTDISIGLGAEMEGACDDGVLSLRLNTEDAGVGYSVSITISETTIAVYDHGAVGNVGTTLATTAGQRVAVRLRVAGGKVFAAARLQDSGDYTSRKWTILANGTALTDTGGTGGGVDYWVQFGRSAQAGLADFTVWRVSGHVLGDIVDAGYAGGFTSPDDLAGRPLSGSSVALDDGLLIRATDGPGKTGDTWSIATRYDYALEHVFEPGRALSWRSTSYAAQSIAVLGDSTAASYQRPMMGLMLLGLTSPIVAVQANEDPSSVSWQTLATVDLRTSFAFVRSGQTVRPTPSGTVTQGPYVEHGELAGGLLYLPSAKVRRIAHNTEGYLTSGDATVQRCIIYIDPDDLDETEAASGTASILPPDATIILRDVNEELASGFRVQFDPAGAAPAPPQGYVGCSAMLLGDFVAFGTPPTRNRRMPLSANVSLTETPSGSRSAKVLGRPRAAFELSWTEGVDTLFTVDSNNLDDTIVAAEASEPVASRRDTPRVVDGVYRAIDGASTVIGYVPYVPNVLPSSVAYSALSLNRARGSRMCRIIGRLEKETLEGEAEQAELVRFSLTLEEEV